MVTLVAFTNVIPKTRINDKERLVDITYQIEKGNKVYFNKINVLGNHRTRIKSFEELQIVEGELYNESRKTESLESVKATRLFEDVSFNTTKLQRGILNYWIWILWLKSVRLVLSR